MNNADICESLQQESITGVQSCHRHVVLIFITTSLYFLLEGRHLLSVNLIPRLHLINFLHSTGQMLFCLSLGEYQCHFLDFGNKPKFCLVIVTNAYQCLNLNLILLKDSCCRTIQNKWASNWNEWNTDGRLGRRLNYIVLH